MSATELVDIVNENNEVIKTVTRREMRQEQLPHRASYIAVMDRQNKFLVEIRTLCKDYSPGTFDAVVGGVMQHGEVVGINADDKNNEFYPLGTLRIDGKTDNHFFYGYLYLCVADAITVRQQEEVSGVMFIEESEVLRLQDNCNYDSVVAFKEILKRAREGKILK